jgi:cyclopropane fatty-acyl-phospholipid synthase-like methyltransferase
MRAIDVSGFERKFRENIDPWDYTNSGFEHFKRTVLLRACGHGKHGRALEVGCAIGETTRYLAPLCLRLVALDGSPTALVEASRRVHCAHVRFVQARLPGEMPRGPFDLIVVSEIAYYFSVHELALFGKRLAAAIAHRGIIVLLHNRRHFQDAAQSPVLAHLRLRSQLSRIATPVFEERYPRFDVTALRRRRG